MKSKFLLYITLLFAFKSFSQKPITKIIVDAKTKRLLEFVYISTNDKKLSTITNKEGQFIVINSPTITTYHFYKIGFAKQTLSFEQVLKLDTIFLNEKAFNLDEISVSAITLETVVKDKRFYVEDYVVLPNSDFVIITSKINVKGFDIAYYKKDKGITFKKKLSTENNASLFTDAFKNIHLVSNQFSHQLVFDSDSSFDFLPKFKKSKFDSLLAPCVLSIDTALIFKSFLPPVKAMGYKFDHTLNSPFVSYIKKSKTITHELYTVYYTNEIRQMITNEENDYDMIIKHQKELGKVVLTEAVMENGKQLFYNKTASPIYAPIYLQNDTILIFDFQEKQIVFLTSIGTVLKEVKLNTNDFTTLHDFEIIADPILHHYYFKTKIADKISLTQINIYSGKSAKKTNLQKLFAKNIKVVNGKIYYLYKEKEWDDTCYLYEQRF